MIRTKEDFIKACAKYVELKKALLTFDRTTPYTFCITERADEIHISDIGEITFDRIINLLQPIVHYNPNYTQTSGMKYFYLPIDGHDVKVFALWEKQS